MTEPGSSNRLGRIVAELEALIGREEVAEGYVRFRVMLLGAQVEVFDELTRSASPTDVAFEGRLLGGLLKGLASALTAGDGNEKILDRLCRTADRDPEFLTRLARDTTGCPAEDALESLAEEPGIGVEAILFFGRVLAAPFVTHSVCRLKQTALGLSRSSGECPWCGSPPGLARLVGDEGSRLLCCSLCGETWPYSLLRCPTCRHEEDHDRLWLEPDDPCFVQVCGNCRGYLKTVDERKLAQGEAVIPLVWATATMHLDLIAQREGCQRAFPYAALT